jgi:hypothetical protein
LFFYVDLKTWQLLQAKSILINLTALVQYRLRRKTHAKNPQILNFKDALLRSEVPARLLRHGMFYPLNRKAFFEERDHVNESR